MAKHTKYLAVCVMVLSLAVSCRKHDPAADGMSGMAPVEFGASGVWSKAVVRDDGFVAGDAIGVMGYYVPPGEDWDVYRHESRPDFMYTRKVSYDGISWSYSPVAYWPQKDGAEVNFYAYFPWNESSSGEGVSVSSAMTQGEPSFTFVLNESADVDLMVAKNEGMASDDGPVYLDFHHMLGKLQFKFGVTDEGGFSYVVNKIKVLSTPHKAEYSWGEDSFTVLSSAPVVASAGEHGVGHLVNSTEPVLADAFTMFLMPGRLGVIEITINNEDARQIDLSDVMIESGKVMTVKMIINLTGIQFYTSVSDWKDGGTANGNIS